MGIKQHRCRLPGVSVLQLTPFVTSEFRVEKGGGEKERIQEVLFSQGFIRTIVFIVPGTNSVYGKNGIL